MKDFYRDYIFRKLRFGAYIGRQKTEANLIKNFKQKYGQDASKVLIGVGDWSGGGGLKFQRPYLKSKKFCEMFQKAGFNVCLINEFITSKMCCACGGITETFRYSNCLFIYLFIFYAYFVVFKLLHNKTFRWVENPRPYRRSTRPWVKCHGLVRCTSCPRLFCRDNNGSSNIWKILYNAVHDEPRPAYLCRQNPVGPP